ncbi:MAG TPA: hypothetical protein VJ803_06110 [Gemmatimonadaceae bacterium]|nr:hypothetical protein [Gemmatimonadaceae bacterium]
MDVRTNHLRPTLYVGVVPELVADAQKQTGALLAVSTGTTGRCSGWIPARSTADGRAARV